MNGLERMRSRLSWFFAAAEAPATNIISNRKYKATSKLYSEGRRNTGMSGAPPQLKLLLMQPHDLKIAMSLVGVVEKTGRRELAKASWMYTYLL